ncbi:MAG TPA: DUF2195 family protein [Bordetella sp.]|nr:DUF2195 family protein [Bordetella sp.]
MSNKFPRLAAVLAAVLCGTAAHAAGSIKLENALAACVDVRPGMRTTTDGQVLLQAGLDLKQSIGRCGCKSAIATYTSQVELDGGHRSFLQSGALRVKQSGPHTLTLASDEKLVGDRNVVLSLGCAAPD